MYRVSYYFSGSSAVAMKEFPDFESAVEFSFTLPTGDLREIKYYPDGDNYTPKEEK